MVKEKTLFEIPIYSMSQDTFNRRWKNHKEKLIEKFVKCGHTAESAIASVDHCCYPKYLWKYNQIIGYITISISSNDVWFNVYCSMQKKYGYNNTKKQYAVDWHINGCHFRVNETDNNDDIKQQVREWLDMVVTDHLKHRYYVNLSVFNSAVEYMDIKAAINDLMEYSP